MKKPIVLALVLAASASAEILTVTAERTLPAPPAHVMRALTQPYYLERWWEEMFRREKCCEVTASDDGGTVRAAFTRGGVTLERWTLEERTPHRTVWLIDFGAFKARRVIAVTPDRASARVRWYEVADVPPPVRKMLDPAAARKDRELALDVLGELTSTLRKP